MLKPIKSQSFILTGVALIIIDIVQRGVPLLVTGIVLILIGIATLNNYLPVEPAVLITPYKGSPLT